MRCGGCGQEVRETCGNHHGDEVKQDDRTLYFICRGGKGDMPHYAICENPERLDSHYLTRIVWSREPIEKGSVI